MQVIIVGGNVNSKLLYWLKQLGIAKFNHKSTRLSSIDRTDLSQASSYLASSIPFDAIVLSIGPLAHRLLTDSCITHAILPSTTITNKKIIEQYITQCREYLIKRRFYDHPTGSGAS